MSTSPEPVRRATRKEQLLFLEKRECLSTILQDKFFLGHQ